MKCQNVFNNFYEFTETVELYKRDVRAKVKFKKYRLHQGLFKHRILISFYQKRVDVLISVDWHRLMSIQ